MCYTNRRLLTYFTLLSGGRLVLNAGAPVPILQMLNDANHEVTCDEAPSTSQHVVTGNVLVYNY